MEAAHLGAIHHGHNIKRLRDILGIKQEVIAHELNITQQAMSKLEQKEYIDDETLEKVSKAMGISAESIKNFTDEAAINIIASTFDNQSFVATNCYPTFNPVDKVVELYERLLETEREKNALLEKMLGDKE